MSSMWVYGRHAVVEALRAGAVEQVLIESSRRDSRQMEEIRRLAAAERVPVASMLQEELDRLAGGQPTQGVAARVREPRLVDLSVLLRTNSRVGPAPFLLVLDQIQDPHNLGALLRTADAAGVQGVVLPERGAAPLSATVARSSAGAINHVSIARTVNLARALRAIREAGIWLVGLDESASQDIFSADLTVPLALVVGSEGTGMRRLTREQCDLLLRIPVHGSIESLNASVAGGVAMYEVVRQRLAARPG